MKRNITKLSCRSFNVLQASEGWTAFRFAAAVTVLMILAAVPVQSFAEDSEVLAQGVWTKKTAAIKGSWRIVEDNGRRYLELDQEFKTKKAPDLKAFLSPRSVSDLKGATATQGATLIGALSSHKGKQRLAVPATVNMNDFRSLIIHCEKYDKLWGGADLR